MTFGEVSQLVHPDDIKLYEVAAQLADAKTNAIDHDFRMHHASGKWVWLRARCELVQQPGEPGVHLIGIARRHHRAEDAGRADRRRRHPPARRHRDHPGSLRAVGSREPPGAVQLELPEPAQPARRGDRAPARPTKTVVAAGRKHVIRSKLASEDPAVPGARTFEAQLDDGHWLQISERRTKDGGYVSVGTDITPLKQHEKKLIDSEQRLMATVTDLRQSQQKLEIAGPAACRDLAQNAPRRPTRPSPSSSPT